MTNPARSNGGIGVLIFAALLALYLANGDFLPINDARVNAIVADSILYEGNVSIGKTEAPDMFEWLLRTPKGDEPIEIWFFDDELRALLERGAIVPDPDDGLFRYVIAPTLDPDLYVNTFSLGATVVALPVLAPLSWWVGGLANHPCAMWHGCKVVAAASVALSAVFIFLTAARFLPRRLALTLTIAYALGTGVWSTSSQMLWQHGPNELFLALAAYFLVRLDEKPVRMSILVALALSMATWCRPTGALAAVTVGAFLLVYRPRLIVPYALAGLPFALALFAYNQHYFGSPFIFGQTRITNVAEAKTGNPDIWQGSVIEGALGLLVSPSRGLFIYSPFLLFSLWGVVALWRRAEFRWLRPWTVAVAAIWLVEFHHFDWWGGWSYGYRHIVDTVVFLGLFLVPVLPAIYSRGSTRWLFRALLAWSIFVQFLGAVACDLRGWNARDLIRIHLPNQEEPLEFFEMSTDAFAALGPEARLEIKNENIDLVENRHRLWSWDDNQIYYHLIYAPLRTVIKRMEARTTCDSFAPQVATTHAQIADIYRKQGELALAEQALATAFARDPGSPLAHRVQGEIHRSAGRLDEAAASFQRELDSHPHSVEALVRLGLVRREQGKFADASRHFQEALKLNPEHAEARHWLERTKLDEIIP